MSQERPYPYTETSVKSNAYQLTDSGSTNVLTDRPSLYDNLIDIQGDLLYVDINSLLFNSTLSNIILPVDVDSLLYNGMKVFFKQKDNSSFNNSGLQYSFPYYIKKLSPLLIELYFDKSLNNKVYFVNGMTGIHQLVIKVNPYKFDFAKLLPSERQLEELHILTSEIMNYLIQMESDYVESYEKITNGIKNKYLSYFDLEEDLIKELIYESGYGYILDLGLNVGTSDLSVLYSYMKLFHLFKGSREGLEFVLQMLGYDSRLIEWWEMPVVNGLSIGQPATFDILINIVNQQTLTIEQSKKLRIFTRYYVYPLLRYIIQDILLEFSSLGLGTSGFVDKVFEFDSSFNTLIFSLSGFSDLFFNPNLLSPNFEEIVPYHYDFFEGDFVSLSLGDTFDYVVLNDNVVENFYLYLTNPSVFGVVEFSLKINGIVFLNTFDLSMSISQNTLDIPALATLVKGDLITLTVETLHVSDVNVGNSILFGLY